MVIMSEDAVSDEDLAKINSLDDITASHLYTHPSPRVEGEREFIESLVVENDTDEWLEVDNWGPDYGSKADEAYRNGAADEEKRISRRARAFLATLVLATPDESTTGSESSGMATTEPYGEGE